MRSLQLWSLPCLFLACNEPDDPCLSKGSVHLVTSDNPRFTVDLAGGHTFVSFDGDWQHDRDHALYVGEACGADARMIDVGLSMTPVRLHPDDPDAEDPSLVCDDDREFFRLDLDGERPPALLFPHLNCGSLLSTPHGPVIADRNTSALWHLPNFPDDDGALEVSAEFYSYSHVWLDGRLFYVTAEGIHRRDLVTGADELLVPGALNFLHTETHLLWQARVAGDIAPMNVRDLATGKDHYLGLFHRDEDEYTWEDPGPGWRFDGDGAHVLHLPNVPNSMMSAFELTGAEVPFAGRGVRLAYPAVGGVVVQDGLTLRHAFAGSATGTTLDPPKGAILGDLQVIGDHLEVRADRDLYAVPLDGGPPVLLLRGVGAARTRIDDRLLLSLDEHELTLFHQPSSTWRPLAYGVEQFVYRHGHGVYYSRLGAPESPLNGVWLLSDENMRATFMNCTGICP